MSKRYDGFSLTVIELTDIELIERARAGDHNAFSQIVKRYKSKVAGTIIGMLGKSDDADDIGQEVFIRFYNSINNFRGESSLGTYLTRIAINLSLNEIKRKKLKRIFSFEKILDEGQDIMNEDMHNVISENKEIIQNAVQKLNVKYRTVLVLRLIDDYSTEETAKILIPIGTVLSRLSKGSNEIKGIFKTINGSAMRKKKLEKLMYKIFDGNLTDKEAYFLNNELRRL